MILRSMARKAKTIDPEGRRLIGRTIETDEPLLGLPGNSCTYASPGAGKTTCVAMPGLISLIASQPEKAVLVSDPKDGEIAAQALPMLKKLGRKVAIIDDFGVRPELSEYRVDLNAFGAQVATYKRDPRDILFANETASNALIEEPADGDLKNFFFRQSPRFLIDFGCSALLKRSTALCTPGTLSALLYDTDMLMGFAEIEAEEGDPALQAQARGVLEMKNSEHFHQHLSEAVRALRIFGPGLRLESAGRNATLSHEDLIREGYVIFLVGPQSLMPRLGPYYALHLGSFVQALYQNIGSLRIIADEYTNSPLKTLIGEAITTVRGYGGEFHLIAQSRSEVQRKYGELLTQTIEDNCVVKQWIGGFSSFEEAKRASDAMGEEHAVATGMSSDSDSLKSNTSLSLIKQQMLSPSQLMALDPAIQLVWMKGVGFFLARTISQAQIAPYCDLIAPNPLEGGKLSSDPKITLVTPRSGSRVGT